MDITALHHVSIPVSHLNRSKEFYRKILGLQEIPRPNFPFQGAWFQVAGRQELHLILQHTHVTYRGGKGIDPGDIHFAVRVKSYRATLEFLRSQGYREDADAADLMLVLALPQPITGYPQIYILDPDRHLIEINAETLD
jgi:catechol 2,3-dioxygenase-like lactoylglutathione lyase family enzyme